MTMSYTRMIDKMSTVSPWLNTFNHFAAEKLIAAMTESKNLSDMDKGNLMR